MKHSKLSERWKRMATLQMNGLIMLLSEDFSSIRMHQWQCNLLVKWETKGSLQMPTPKPWWWICYLMMKIWKIAPSTCSFFMFSIIALENLYICLVWFWVFSHKNSFQWLTLPLGFMLSLASSSSLLLYCRHFTALYLGPRHRIITLPPSPSLFFHHRLHFSSITSRDGGNDFFFYNILSLLPQTPSSAHLPSSRSHLLFIESLFIVLKMLTFFVIISNTVLELKWNYNSSTSIPILSFLFQIFHSW